MGTLRFIFGVLPPAVYPIGRLEVLSTCKYDSSICAKQLMNLITIAKNHYGAHEITPDEPVWPRITEKFPVGAAVILEFQSHKEQLKFYELIKTSAS